MTEASVKPCTLAIDSSASRGNGAHSDLTLVNSERRQKRRTKYFTLGKGCENRNTDGLSTPRSSVLTPGPRPSRPKSLDQMGALWARLTGRYSGTETTTGVITFQLKKYHYLSPYSYDDKN